MDFSTTKDFALQLDKQDKLTSFRDLFLIHDPSSVVVPKVGLCGFVKSTLLFNVRCRENLMNLFAYSLAIKMISCDLSKKSGGPPEIERRMEKGIVEKSLPLIPNFLTGL